MKTGSELGALNFCELLYMEKEKEKSISLVCDYVETQIVSEDFEHLNDVIKLINLDEVNPYACTVLLRSTFRIRKHLSEWGNLLNRIHKSFDKRGLSISLLRGILTD